MPIPIVCPSCQARYRVPDQYAGKSATCKKCNTRIPVPAGESEVDLGEIAALDAPAAAARSISAAAQRSAPPAASPNRAAAAEPGFGEDDDLRAMPDRDPNAVRPISVGPDPWSGLLVLLYLATLGGVGLFNQYSTGRMAMDLRAAMPVGGLWTNTVIQGVLFFVLVAPLAMVGVYAASQILRFALAPAAYLKSAGAAAAPLVGIGLATLIIGRFLTRADVADGTSPLVGAVSVIGILGGLTASVFLLRAAFGLNWAETGAAFAMAALLGGIGIGLQNAIGDSLSRTITVAMKFKNTAEPPPVASSASAHPAHAFAVAAPPPAVTDVGTISRLQTLTQQANALSSAQSLSSNPREALASSFATLQIQAASLADDVKPFPDLQARYAALMTTLKSAPALLATVPSAKPDASVYEPIDTAGLVPLSPPDSAADVLDDEVSVGPFRIRPPKPGALDLAAVAASLPPARAKPQASPPTLSALSWTTPEGGRITVATSPKLDARQQRPWVRVRPFMMPAAGLFGVDDTAVAGASGSAALLNQMVMTRVAAPDESTAGRFEQFISLQGDTWVTATAQAADAARFAAVDAAARSLRYAPADPQVNPLTPNLLANRLGDDGAATLLRWTGPSAEPAVIEKLHDRNVRIRQAAIAVLGDIGSQKSIATLAEVVRSNDTFCAEAAKASLRKLAPTKMDATNEALLDLEGSNPQQRRSAMLKLAELKPDEARRPRVAAALQNIILDGPLGENSEVDAAGDALAVWQTPDTLRALLPLLDPSATPEPARRSAGLEVFAKLHDPRAAYQVGKYLASNPPDPEPAMNSLVAMGPLAEVETIRQDLLSPTPAVRKAACEVLTQIGGKKSLNALGPVVRDPRDVQVAAAARSAMLTIKDRVGASDGEPAGLFDLGK